MDWLNYHHLMYFWVVARQGSIVQAAEELNVSQPTISGQIKELEAAMGEPLFNRVGRRLVLSEVGRTVFNYANEIFALGRELQDAVKQKPTGRPMKLVVGMTSAMPKLVAKLLIEPAIKMGARVLVREDKLDCLLSELVAFRLDVVLSDVAIGPTVKVKGYNHLLGESDITFYGTEELARKYVVDFPSSLNGAPMLLPSDNMAIRRSIDHWLEQNNVRPQVLAEFEDHSMMRTFGADGAGIFPAPTLVSDEVRRQYQVHEVGRLTEVRERFYAISIDRKIKHPAVVRICEAAREELFV